MIPERLVSIVICAYNAGAFLVPSIRSALDQTYRNIEVLVVDDGSTDGSIDAARDVIKDQRLRWLRQENAGKPTALNLALGQLRGDYYAIQDADDLSNPRRIELLAQCMESNPDLAAVYSGHELLIGKRRVAPTFRAKDREACRDDIVVLRMPAHDPTGMYRMAMVGDLRYSQNLLLGEGYDYILRVGERWPMMVVGECLYCYRIHDGSITRSDPERRTRLVLEVHRRAHERRGIPVDQLQVIAPSSNCHRDGDNNLAAQFIESVLDQRAAGKRLSAIATGLQCSRLHSLDPHYYKALAYAVMPRCLIEWMRHRRARNGN